MCCIIASHVYGSQSKQGGGVNLWAKNYPGDDEQRADELPSGQIRGGPMKLRLLAAILFLSTGWTCAAQQNPADAPATKEDIQRYLQIVHSKEMAEKMMDAMSKPLHQMVHEQYLKDKDKLPADFDVRMNKRLDEYFKDLPWDEIL